MIGFGEKVNCLVLVEVLVVVVVLEVVVELEVVVVLELEDVLLDVVVIPAVYELKKICCLPEDVMLAQTINTVCPLAEIACEATSFSATEVPKFIGGVNEAPPLELSTATASHGLVVRVPVLRYQATKIDWVFATTVTGHELSNPFVPIARGVVQALPPVDMEKYSCELALPGLVL